MNVGHRLDVLDDRVAVAWLLQQTGQDEYRRLLEATEVGKLSRQTRR
jgi:hypothetical protein